MLLDTLYKVPKKRLIEAGIIASDAFQDDPLWQKIFEGEEDVADKRAAAFEVTLRLANKYGSVYAPSDKLEGVLAFFPGKKSAITFWRMLCSGAIFPGIRMGSNAGKLMGPIFDPPQKDRFAYMKNRDFIYLCTLGIKKEFHGQGFGGTLLRAVIEQSEEQGVALYLDTDKEENVAFYEKFGFKVIKKIKVPIIAHSMWEMIREPEGKG